MPSTYSINDNTVYEATRVASISDALNLLPDNTNKLIAPRDVRDAIYSAWESSVFKQTIGSASIEYIGIDRNDIRQKFLIGKKRIGGLDVLNSTLLNYSFNDTDIFFFNNKPGVTPSNTKIAFLAGTNSSLYPLAPYFDSYSSTSSTLNLDIVNQTGDIILDGGNSGRVSINNVTFPTKIQTASASNGQILKYNNGVLVWGDNTINIATIGSTSSITNIWGSPVLINGFNMELVDSNPIIATFGHIGINQTFSNAPIVEVVRQMLYPYLEPVPSLLINVDSTGWTTSAVAEYGSLIPSSIDLDWSITKRSDEVIFSSLSNATGFTDPSPISTPGMATVSSPPYATGNLPGGFSEVYTLTVIDSGSYSRSIDSMALFTGGGTQGTFTASVTLDLVYPFFYGLTTSNVSTSLSAAVGLSNSVLPYMTKLVETKSDKSLSISGTGYIYIMYPSVYGTFSQILDQNGFDITSSFVRVYSPTAPIDPLLTSPSAYWSGVSYTVYKHGPTTVVPSFNNWQFKY